jgi:hypothetical protein
MGSTPSFVAQPILPSASTTSFSPLADSRSSMMSPQHGAAAPDLEGQIANGATIDASNPGGGANATGLLSKGTSFRLIVSGQVGVKEIERFIKKLEIDKEILADFGEAESEAMGKVGANWSGDDNSK